MKSEPLHIVEPILNDETGHCMSLVRSLVEAARQLGQSQVVVWGGKDLVAPPDVSAGVTYVPHFVRRYRKLQAPFLYARLLRQPGRLLISTASSVDLISLDLVARMCRLGAMAPGKVSLFVHWLNIKPGKARRFTQIAQRQPGWQILAPTQSVVDFFSSCGFHAQLVPYPLDLHDTGRQDNVAQVHFRHLLVPGSARMDKGFGHVVQLVEYLKSTGHTWPMTIQTSLEHGHDKDVALQEALARLKTVHPSHVQLVDASMDRAAYQALFQGAVVIQPYSRESFQDRVSGVTLDALNAGAPLVVTGGTWMARMVSGHGCGEVVDTFTPAEWGHAIARLVNRYEDMSAQARMAGESIRSEHSAQGLLRAVLA